MPKSITTYLRVISYFGLPTKNKMAVTLEIDTPMILTLVVSVDYVYKSEELVSSQNPSEGGRFPLVHIVDTY